MNYLKNDILLLLLILLILLVELRYLFVTFKYVYLIMDY